MADGKDRKKPKKEKSKDVTEIPSLPKHSESPETLSIEELEAIIGEYNAAIRQIAEKNRNPWNLDHLLKEAVNKQAEYVMEKQRRLLSSSDGKDE